jgi:predicted amidohydrolase
MTLTLSLAQIDIVLGEPQANLAAVAPLVEKAARRGSQLLLLPELWTTGYILERAHELAETLDGPTARQLQTWAVAYRLWIVGSLLLRDADGVANAAPLFGPEGQILGPYRKIHRFGPMAEDRWLSAGHTPGLFDLPWGLTGLAICYDLRFPELFRHYALAGARLILIPSEWPHPRLAHWRTLLRARAIENQCFVAACNRVGTTGTASFFGASAVIDPWGETLVEAGEVETLLTVTIDTTLVDEVRRRIPVFEDRRPELY